jgi:uncharacterized membrane protein YcaP (DUF421 family)
MSSGTTTSGSNIAGNATTNGNSSVIVTAAGPNLIQVEDFYQRASILHPFVVGSIAVIFLFTYLRLGSNRSVAPITVFDWIINVALGSTLAGIVNGNSLTRGIEALVTMLMFQYVTSYASSNFRGRLERIFRGPPLVVAFRGKMLTKIMKNHRISPSDVYSAMRQQGILNISRVECAIIEANGNFSIFTTQQFKESEYEPTALQDVPAYCVLVDRYDEENDSNRDGDGSSNSGNNDSNISNGSKSTPDGDVKHPEAMSDAANDAAGRNC